MGEARRDAESVLRIDVHMSMQCKVCLIRTNEGEHDVTLPPRFVCLHVFM